MPYSILTPDYTDGVNKIITQDYPTTCTSCEDIWGYWTTPSSRAYGYTSTSATTQTIWTNWITYPEYVRGAADVRRLRNNHYAELALSGAVVAPETDEEKAARLERMRLRAEEQARIDAERAEARKVAVAKAEVAHARARELLMSQLSPSQRKQYRRDKAFTVVGVSGRRYLIREGWAGNVDELDAGGKAVNRLCIHPTIGVPTPDNMLVQKLMLDTDEEQFRRTANHTRLVV